MQWFSALAAFFPPEWLVDPAAARPCFVPVASAARWTGAPISAPACARQVISSPSAAP